MSGAWQDGDPHGRRQFAELPGGIRLEAGGVLPSVRIAYETWGQLNAEKTNAVLVVHALTGDSHATGVAEPGHPTAGWWSGLIGKGCALDPADVFVVAPNVLGGCQGTTGPATFRSANRRWGGAFPFITVRDQVAAEFALSKALGVERWLLIIGGSMGGMRALEWGTSFPERVRGLFLLATCAAATADQISWCTAQIEAIVADPGWHGGDYYDAAPGRGPHRGLGIARRIAHTTYRSELELGSRFGNRMQDGGDPFSDRYAVESYLEHQADSLVRRFDAGSYVTLTRAMNAHDVGRGRGGVAEALSRVTADAVVAGIDSDRLYALTQQQEIAAGLGVALDVINSPYGHDGFLLETDQVGALLAKQMSRIGAP